MTAYPSDGFKLRSLKSLRVLQRKLLLVHTSFYGKKMPESSLLENLIYILQSKNSYDKDTVN